MTDWLSSARIIDEGSDGDWLADARIIESDADDRALRRQARHERRYGLNPGSLSERPDFSASNNDPIGWSDEQGRAIPMQGRAPSAPSVASQLTAETDIGSGQSSPDWANRRRDWTFPDAGAAYVEDSDGILFKGNQGHLWTDTIRDGDPTNIAFRDGVTAGDYGRAAMGTAAATGAGIGWILEQIGAEDIGGTLRELGQEGQQWWMEGMSDAAKEAMSADFLGADASWDLHTIGLHTASSMIPTMLGMGSGMIVARGLGALGGAMTPVVGRGMLSGPISQALSNPTVSGAIGYGIGEAGVSVGMAGLELVDAVMNAPIDQLMKNQAFRDLYESLPDDASREVTARAIYGDTAGRRAAAMTGGTTFAMTAPAGALFGRWAAQMRAAREARMPTGMKPSPETRAGAIGAGAGTEFLQEFGQSGAEQLNSNIVQRQMIDPEGGLFDGVANAAVGGALSGAVMGGAFGAATPINQGAAQEQARQNAIRAAVGDRLMSPDMPGPNNQFRPGPIQYNETFQFGQEIDLTGGAINQPGGTITLSQPEAAAPVEINLLAPGYGIPTPAATNPAITDDNILDQRIEQAAQLPADQLPAPAGAIGPVGPALPITQQPAIDPLPPVETGQMPQPTVQPIASASPLPVAGQQSVEPQVDAIFTDAAAEQARAALPAELGLPAADPVPPTAAIGSLPQTPENNIPARPPQPAVDPTETVGRNQLPKNLPDTRLMRRTYREGLVGMMGELRKGGEVTFLQNADAGFINARGERVAGGGDNIRTSSTNPEWFKSLGRDLFMDRPLAQRKKGNDKSSDLTVDMVTKAVDRALSGKQLGVRQVKIINTMMDEIQFRRAEADSQYGPTYQTWQDMLRTYRDRRRAVTGKLTDAAVDTATQLEPVQSVYAEDVYTPDLTPADRMILDVALQTGQGDVDMALAMLEKHQGRNQGMDVLWAEYTESFNEPQQQGLSGEQGQGDQGTQGTAEARSEEGPALKLTEQTEGQRQLEQRKREIAAKLDGDRAPDMIEGAGELFAGPRPDQVDIFGPKEAAPIEPEGARAVEGEVLSESEETMASFLRSGALEGWRDIASIQYGNAPSRAMPVTSEPIPGLAVQLGKLTPVESVQAAVDAWNEFKPRMNQRYRPSGATIHLNGTSVAWITEDGEVRVPERPSGQIDAQSEAQPDFNEMVAAAARWRGAARNAGRGLDGREGLRHSNMTTKGDLDAYLMKRFGIDESAARDVSNELTRRNIPDDLSADPAEFAGEPWARETSEARPEPQSQAEAQPAAQPETQQTQPEPAQTAQQKRRVNTLNQVLKEANDDGGLDFKSGQNGVYIDVDPDGSVALRVQRLNTRYKGRVIQTEETNWSVDYDAVKDSLTAEARALVEAARERELAEYAAMGQPAQAEAQQAAAEPAAPIEDFGEKIVGARKDYAETLQAATEKDVAAVPLSESWPQPDYQKLIDEGADPKVIALVRALRDEVPAKPRRYVGQWAAQVESLRDFSIQLMSDPALAADFTTKVPQAIRNSGRLMGRADLYEQFGHEKSLKGIWFTENHYSLYRGEENVTKWVVEQKSKSTSFSNFPRELAVGNTRDEALAKFRGVYDSLGSKQRGPIKFGIWSDHSTGDIFIGRKIGKNIVRVQTGFEDVKAARKHLNENQKALEAKLERMRDIPAHRNPSNAPRVGNDHLGGREATPDVWQETFGFRGVQFGNWVEQSRRQDDLNNAFDALMDLAGVIDVPARALSLNGELGLAFGARGRGGKGAAAAHYEPDQVVINLTKREGAGSLAHEWWHSLDNHFGKRHGRSSFMTEGEQRSGEIRPEVVDAFNQIVRAMRTSGMFKRAQKLDEVRSKDYWSTAVELSARAFEAYVIEKLADQNAANDYLANIVSEQAWEAAEGDAARYPYPTPEEMAPIRAAFDHFFQTVETKETDTGVAMYSMGQPSATPESFRAALGPRTHRALTESGLMQFVDGLDSVPGNHPEMAAAVYLNGKAYINTRMVAEGAEVGLVLHEIGVHEGMRDFIGQEAYDRLSAQLQRQIDRGQRDDAPKAARQAWEAHRRAQVSARASADYYKAQNGREMSQDHYNRVLMEETWAYMAEHGANSSLWQRFVAAIKTALVRMGLAPRFVNGLNNADIASLARGSVARVVDRVTASQPSYAPAMYQSAYHGTPYLFDRFSLSKIGTGEGAQAYGWGLYFAGHRAVAEYYRDALAGRVAESQTPAGHAERALGLSDDDANEAIRILRANMNAMSGTEAEGRISEAIRMVESGYKRGGSLYQVDIPESDTLLDWDKPLSEQPEVVKEAFRAAAQSETNRHLRRLWERAAGEKADNFWQNGQEFYRGLVSHYSQDAPPYVSVDQAETNYQREASHALNGIGIPGLRYLDGPSRRRPLRDIKREFLAEIGQDAEFGEVMDLLGTGVFSAQNEAVLRALDSNDWLGFDYPAQAISAALGGNIQNWDPSPELLRAISDAQGGGTHNYVIWDENAVTIEAINDQQLQADTLRYSENFDALDTQHRAAVESGDMETAQRLVDEAARAAGYTSPKVYRGHEEGQNVFATTLNTPTFTDSEAVADYYAENPAKGAGGKLTAAYLGMKNPLEFGEDGALTKDALIDLVGADLAEKIGSAGLWMQDGYQVEYDEADGGSYAEAYAFADNRDFLEWAQEQGFDGFVYEGFFSEEPTPGKDLGSYRDGFAKEWRPFSVEQIKSADPATYDDSGNLIPLSERFNRASDDIRYSVQRAVDLAAEKFADVRTKSEEKFFRDFWPKLLRRTGLRRPATARNILRGVRQAIQDIEAWLRDNPRFMEYYEADMAATREVLAEYFPDITAEQFEFFRAMLGVTSPSTMLPSNVNEAILALDMYRRDGNFDAIEMGLSEKGNVIVTSSPISFSNATAPNKARSLKVLERLAREQGGLQQALDYLKEMIPAKDLHAFKKEMGYKGNVAKIGQIRALTMAATGQDLLIPRAFIFGSKVGAYTLNTMGDGRFTTIDIWESRFIRSYFADMFGEKQAGLPKDAAEHALFEEFNRRFRAEMEAKYGQEFAASALQAMRWFYILNAAQRAGYTGAKTNKTISEYSQASIERLRKRDRRDGQQGTSGSQARYSIAETVEVDGQQRPTQNSEGRPIHPTEEGIRNFWRWFGDSQAVDADGRPLVVYHGTRNPGFSAFNTQGETSASGDDFTLSPLGAWLTDSTRIADNFATDFSGVGADGAVMPVLAKIRNPYEISYDDLLGMVSTQKEARDLRARIESEGYDGMKVGRYGGQDGFDYVAFSPNQIKSATGNTGEFGPSSDIRYSVSRKNQPQDWEVSIKVSKSDPAYETVREALEMAGLQKPKSDRWYNRLQQLAWGQVKDHTLDARRRATQGSVDRFYGLKLAEQQFLSGLPHEQSAYVAARLSTGIASTMRGLLHHGAPEWRDGIISRVDGSKGLLEILRPVKGDLNAFMGWMVGRRAERLRSEGRENLFEEKHIEALIANGRAAKSFSQFEKVAAEVDQFKKRILDVAEQAGLIDPVSRAAWDQSDYVPFYRVVEGDRVAAQGSRQALSGQTSGIRKLKGGTAALNDPLENLIMNFTHLMDASMKNHAILQARRNLAASGLFEDVSPEWEAAIIPLSQVKKRLSQAGVDVTMLPPAALRGMAKMWALKNPGKNDDVVRIMEGGKAKYYRVTDPLLLRSLTAIRDPGLNIWPLRVARAAKRIFTRGVTADPAFMARNFMRDMLHAWTINEDHFKVGIDSIRGAVKTLRERGGYIDMAFSGASFMGGYVNANDPGEVARELRRSLRMKGYSAASANRFVASVMDTPLKFWEFYTGFGDAVENASREAVYEAAIKAGKSRAQAAFESKDLMDYSMRGDWVAVQALTDTVPFLNARIQGLYKLGRAGHLNPKRVAIKGMVIAMASLALLFRNHDDERYKDLEEWDKDTYWHVFLPEPINVGGAMLSHVRIPKPFEVGVIFGTVPERIALNMLNQDDSRKTYERFLWSIRQTLAFDPIPQAIAPAAEVWAGWDRFRDRPIESFSDRMVRPEDRFNAYTSPTMVALGRYTGDMGISPKELEHLWRGYLGTLGMYALSVSDVAARYIQGAPPRPRMRIDEYPVIGSFLRAEPARSTKWLTELYQIREELNQIHGSLRKYDREGDFDRWLEIAAEESRTLRTTNENALSVRDMIERGAKDNSDLRKEIDMVFRDESMSPEEKREWVDELISRRNESTKETVQMVREFLSEE